MKPTSLCFTQDSRHNCNRVSRTQVTMLLAICLQTFRKIVPTHTVHVVKKDKHEAVGASERLRAKQASGCGVAPLVTSQGRHNSNPEKV